jgi:uracil-DNA glycosylase
MAEKVSYNTGKNISPVAFMFACPGQKEQKAGKVVAGATGKNLDKLLDVLSASENERIRALFPSSDRYDYLITNSSDSIHYPAYDNTSLPSKSEYSDDDNLNRLCRELDCSAYVIAFGIQAKEACKLVERKYRLCESSHRPVFITSLPHLSLLALNQISEDTDSNRIERGDPDATLKRLRVVAKMLESQLEEYLS